MKTIQRLLSASALILALTIPTIGQIGWTIQVSTALTNLTSVSFPEPEIATVVGELGAVLRTYNGGRQWSQQNCPIYPDNLYGVSFANAQYGTAVGAQGDIIYTSNSGAFWHTAQTGWMITYYAACQPSPMVGYAAGVNTIFQPLVTRTRNGWLSMNHTAFYVVHNGVSNEGNIRGICFVNDSTGYAAVRVWNGEGAIAKTTDYGATWSTVGWFANALNGIDFPTSEVGYAVGFQGIVVKTENAGSSWNTIQSGTAVTLNGVSFAEPDYGFAVGEGGTILRTVNGGANWENQTGVVAVNLRGVDFLTRDAGFVVGDGGTILFTATGGGPLGVTLSLIPVNPPIIVPRGGGWIRFIAEITNPAAYMFQFDAWTHATLPSGQVFGPLMVRTNNAIGANSSISRTIAQYVPPAAPPGSYWINGYLGEYMTREVWLSDSIPFSKSAADCSGSDEWLTSGWGEESCPLNPESRILNPRLSVSPNPFNPATTLSFELWDAAQVKLSVYDIAGREVAVLAEGWMPAGAHQIEWGASAMASGVYFAHLNAGDYSTTVKLLLVK